MHEKSVYVRGLSKVDKSSFIPVTISFVDQKRLANEIMTGFNGLLRLCRATESRSVSTHPQATNPLSPLQPLFDCRRLSLSLSFSRSRSLSLSTTALRKLVNPARNCESTRACRVENDRSNPASGIRFSLRIPEMYVYTCTCIYYLYMYKCVILGISSKCMPDGVLTLPQAPRSSRNLHSKTSF